MNRRRATDSASESRQRLDPSHRLIGIDAVDGRGGGPGERHRVGSGAHDERHPEPEFCANGRKTSVWTGRSRPSCETSPTTPTISRKGVVVLGEALLDPLSDGLSFGHHFRAMLCVDDRDRRRVRRVGVGEEAPGDQGDLHRAEVPRLDDVEGRAREVRLRGRRAVRNLIDGTPAAARRPEGRGSRSRTARPAGSGFPRRRAGRTGSGRVRLVARVGQEDAQAQDAFRLGSPAAHSGHADRLRTRRPEPTARTNASATSETKSARRRPCRERPLVAPRPGLAQGRLRIRSGRPASPVRGRTGRR